MNADARYISYTDVTKYFHITDAAGSAISAGHSVAATSP